jgi:hypothetical protein
MKPLPLFLFLVTLLLPAQSFGQGLTNPWDFKKTIENLTAYSGKLTPILDNLKPEEWSDAPAGYAAQQQLIRTQLASITVLLQALSKDPERLPAVLDLFFRYENFDITLASLLEGVRRYQNPAVADLITGLRNENAPARLGLKEYMVELATTQDQRTASQTADS